MSVELMSKAFKARVGNPTRKLILIKLSDNADDNGRCFPSYSSIAYACEIDRSSVIRHVKAMQELGLLSVKKRFVDGENSSNIFTINIEKLNEMSGGTNPLHSGTNQINSSTNPLPSSTNPLPLVADCHPESSIFNHQLTINNHQLTRESVNALPNWLDVGLWNDWLDSRKKLKAVNSERALAIILKKLNEWQSQGHNPNTIIETSLVSGWKDCYLPKQANGKTIDDGYADFIAQTERMEARSKGCTSGKNQTGNVYEGELS